MIDKFTGRYGFLSNFYPEKVMLDGERYPTVEHAYQAAKFTRDKRAQFRGNISPATAKRLGRGQGGPGWHQRSLVIMEHLLRQKFLRNPFLTDLLLQTGIDELVEGNNWHDIFYGVCAGNCKHGPHAPEGENHLGKLLMKIRAEAQASLLLP